MKLKLSKKQTDSLRTAMLKEQQTKQAFNIARQQAAEAENNRIALMEIVIESHGEDPDKIAGKSVSLSADGYLTFGENGHASKRIKESLKRGAIKRAAKKSEKVPMKNSK